MKQEQQSAIITEAQIDQVIETISDLFKDKPIQDYGYIFLSYLPNKKKDAEHRIVMSMYGTIGGQAEALIALLSAVPGREELIECMKELSNRVIIE